VARSENPSVIVAGARTPIGKLSGALKDLTAMDLGGIAIKAALERSGVSGDQVDYVIRAGEFEVVVAGGMESMTNAPYLLPKARGGYRYGNAEILDATFHDGLFDAFDRVPMGEATESVQHRYDMTREQQDEFAARSHELAAAAIKDGRFTDEIVPVEIPQRKGDPIVVSEDEGVRPGTTAETLAKLKPAFVSSGTLTAGNASQISDGAAAVVVMSKSKAESLGLDNSLQEQPAEAAKVALAKEGRSVSDVDLFELNEAFAAVGIASTIALGVDPAKVNPNGGAIALGHPIGASGARIALHLAHELKRRGGGLGVAALCGGGGQGDALILHVPA